MAGTHPDPAPEHELKNSSTNTDSNRVIITKRAIFDALYELMETRDFADITVADILERSGVSRTTFYRCFKDKFDIVNWSFIRFKEINPQFRCEYYAFDTSLRVQLDYLREHRRYFAHALRYTGQNSLRDTMYEINLDYILQCWREAHVGQDPEYRILAMAQFAAAGMGKVIESWIVNDCPQDPEQIISAIRETTPAEILRLLY